MKVLLDTHIFLWWLLDIPKLTKSQARVLQSVDSGETKACISSMTLWEIATLHSLGRIQFDFSLRDWMRSLYYHEQITVLDLDADIILESAQLREQMPGDPVDQIIVATAKVHHLSLLTSDQKIRKESGIAVI